MNRHEVFFQSEGHTGVRVVEVEISATVRNLMDSAKNQGLVLHEDLILFIEDTEAEHAVKTVADRLLSELLIGHGSKVHFHRSKRISVVVRFDSESISHTFLPSTTIKKIKHWAVQKFKLDASVEVDHGLKVCGQTSFLTESTHIGSLAEKDCEVCLVLSPKRPVQG